MHNMRLERFEMTPFLSTSSLGRTVTPKLIELHA